jgi:hypothetical protein
MASNQWLARLGFVLALDQSEFVDKLTESQKKWKDFGNEAKRDSAQIAKAIVELDIATRNYGKTLTHVEKAQEEIRTGKYAQAQEWEKKLLLQKAAAYDQVAASAKKANEAAMASSKGGITMQQQAALGYQTTDIITSLAGGQNPLMVMLQQGGQLRDQFGGFKPLFAGIAAAITPIGVAVTALGGTILGLGYAMYQGTEESKKLNAALAITGGYAGITASQFNVLAASIGEKYKIGIGDAKEALQMLVASGQFARGSIVSVAETITLFSKVSGESADVVANKLIPLMDGTAGSAYRLNEQYHFLSLSQYKQIESLEKQGEKQKAIVLTSDAFNEKLREQQKALGPLAELWKDVSKGVSDYYDKIKMFLANGPDAAMQLDMAAKHVGAMRAAWGDEDDRTVKALKEYYELLNKLTDKALEREEEGALGEAESKKIEFYKKYGQQLIDISAKTAEDKARTEYAIAAKGLDEISQLSLKKKMEDALAEQEIKRKIAANPQIAGQIGAAADAELARKKAELDLQQSNVSRDELLNYTKKADAEQNSIEKERERLDVYKQNLFASNADLQIALSRLKTEQDIAEIEKNKKLEADPQGRATEIARLEKIQQAREAVINQAADLKMLQDMNQSVFNNMGNAIDNFVRNGKLSFKDLTRSIIQDLISIAMRAQMVSMFKGFSTIGTAFAYGTNIGSQQTSMLAAQEAGMRAAGGPVDAGMPYYVGEQGPELFVPQGAGTIMPNKVLGAMSNNQPQVVYNGPYIANMSAIDTQSGIQFLTKNKQTIWAANQSAQRSLPASR